VIDECCDAVFLTLQGLLWRVTPALKGIWFLAFAYRVGSKEAVTVCLQSSWPWPSGSQYFHLGQWVMPILCQQSWCGSPCYWIFVPASFYAITSWSSLSTTFQNTTVEEVSSLIRRLPDKSLAADLIQFSVLKDMADLVAPYVGHCLIPVGQEGWVG